jgi:hypothetical protein
MSTPPRGPLTPAVRYAADLAIATTFLLRGSTHFVLPDAVEQRSLLARSLPPWDHIWCVLWIVGPLLVLVGAARDRPELVAMGWTLTGLGMALNLIAVVFLHPGDPRSYLSLPFLAFGALRLRQLRAEFRRRPVPARER